MMTIAGPECGNQLFLDVNKKALAIDGTIKQPRGVNAIVTQGGQKLHGFPVAIREAYMNFRNDQYLWWQVGEYPYDNFIIRQRAKG